jgi:predicted transposase/invertase (TIGR01784 family)
LGQAKDSNQAGDRNMLCEIDPKVDFAFKRLFGDPRNSSLAKSLINSTFQDADLRPIVDLEIVNPFNLKETPTDKSSILDIRAKDETGRQINLEMQVINHVGLESRILYYLTRFHSRQLQEGQGYLELKTSISILFIDAIIFPESSRVHNRFRLCDVESGLVFSDQIELHVIELPKLLKSNSELSSDLEQWIYFFSNAKGLDMNALPGGLTVPEIKEALAELLNMSGTQEELDRYFDREMALRNLLTIENESARVKQGLATAEQGLAKAEQKRAQAEQGEIRAQQAAAKADQEKARAEQEKARAEQEKARAEQEKAKAEQEKAKAEQEAAKALQNAAQAEQVAESERRRAENAERRMEQNEASFASKGKLIEQILKLESAIQRPMTSVSELLGLSEDQLREILARTTSLTEDKP